ncbi:MAG: hypothetical protein WC756_10135 [Taibaiella sp.]|jgi:hypothetical protein
MIKTTLNIETINTLVDTLCEKITIQNLNWGLNGAKYHYVHWRFSPVLNNLTLGGYRLFRAVKVLCRPLENLHNNEDPQQALLKILEAGGGTGINSIKWSILHYLLQYPASLHDVSDQEADFIIHVAINKLKKIVLENEIDNIFLNKDDKTSLEKKVMAVLKKYIQERTTMIFWLTEPVEVTEAKDLMNKINEYFGIDAEGDGQVLT